MATTPDTLRDVAAPEADKQEAAVMSCLKQVQRLIEDGKSFDLGDER